MNTIKIICEISGFRREVYQNCALLEYYARVVVILYRRFSTTYHLPKVLPLLATNTPEERSSQ